MGYKLPDLMAYSKLCNSTNSSELVCLVQGRGRERRQREERERERRGDGICWTKFPDLQ